MRRGAYGGVNTHGRMSLPSMDQPFAVRVGGRACPMAVAVHARGGYRSATEEELEGQSERATRNVL